MRLPNLNTDTVLTDGAGRGSDPFRLFLDGIQKWLRRNGGAVYGTNAQRTIATTRGFVDRDCLADGTLYVETDTGIVYQLRAGVWAYYGGNYQRTQSQLAALAASLGTGDAGVLVEVTDYAHILRWSGSAWGWGPGEEGGGYFRPFAVAPTGNGWHACNGAAGVAYLKADGTTGTVTLPNSAGAAAYMKLGAAYANTTTAAAVPTATNPANTGDHALSIGELPSHSHGLSQLKYKQQTTAGSGPDSVIQVPGTAISQTTDAAGSGAAHNHTLAAPTVALPGDPIANFQALLYFRQ